MALPADLLGTIDADVEIDRLAVIHEHGGEQPLHHLHALLAVAGRERGAHQEPRVEAQAIHGLAERDAVIVSPGPRVVVAIRPVVDRRRWLSLEGVLPGLPQVGTGDRNPMKRRAGLDGDVIELGGGEIRIAAAEPEIDVDDRARHGL